ncbi:hypothetical protein Aduo_018954 [Ancylostoma duodenale]
MKIMPSRRMRDERCGRARIKWWRLKEKEATVTSAIKLPPVTTVDETWKDATRAIVEVALSELGTTKPGCRRIDRQAWLWTDEMKVKVRNKKRLYHIFLGNKTDDNWQKYLEAKKAAKKAVAATKAEHYDNVSKKLDEKDGGERLIYRLARSRQRQAEDVGKFYGVDDEHEEFSHPPIPQLPPTYGKATGPDDVAAELWKSRHLNSAEWVTSFFNKVIAEKKTPVDWQRSTTIPIWKRKGNPADCSNYRPIRLLSHSIKIFERIIDRRIHNIIGVTTNQCGFVANCGTTDAIHAAGLMIEKHREKQKPLHLAFLDLEKAFDRVPHEVIWYALRWHGDSEELIEWVKILYADPKSRVQAAAGRSAELPISVGVHQGSALSPLLFIVVMDAVTRDLQRPMPWTLLYADDVMFASEQKEDLERQTQAWSERLARFGLRLNVKKTEYMTTDMNEPATIQVECSDLSRTDYFKYLGSTLSADGNLAHEVVSRINAAWLKRRSLTGVLCDKKIPDRLKSKVYRAVVRPVAVYGAECWPATKEVERRLGVMEMKIL